MNFNDCYPALLIQSPVPDTHHKDYSVKEEDLIIMYRRRFLGLTVCTAGLAGCLQPSESEEEGTPFLLISDRVDDEFSGTLRVVPSCRNEAVDIQITNGEPQDSIPYSRREHGESCSFDLYIDNQRVIESVSAGQ